MCDPVGNTRIYNEPQKCHSPKKRARKLRDRDPSIPRSQIISSNCCTANYFSSQIPSKNDMGFTAQNNKNQVSLHKSVKLRLSIPSLSPASSQDPVPQTGLCFCNSCLGLHNLKTPTPLYQISHKDNERKYINNMLSCTLLPQDFLPVLQGCGKKNTGTKGLLCWIIKMANDL